jgi:hypothetical protein
MEDQTSKGVGNGFQGSEIDVSREKVAEEGQQAQQMGGMGKSTRNH